MQKTFKGREVVAAWAVLILIDCFWTFSGLSKIPFEFRIIMLVGLCIECAAFWILLFGIAYSMKDAEFPSRGQEDTEQSGVRESVPTPSGEGNNKQ